MAQATAPGLSEIIFPTAANHNFSHILTDLKRSNLSVANRLRSCQHDADFVKEVAACYGRPLVANERCGSWYVRPEEKAASAYFKSTDGHTNAWKFSTRRLNLHLLEVIGKHDGCIIVDSTRRGKRMPDALSKTIPVWCTVVNMALFPDDPNSSTLHTPPNVVSPSEHSQIAALLPSFLTSLKALNLDLPSLRAHLSRPLRPFWVTQDTTLSPVDVVFESHHPVICCTSSRRVAGTELSEAGYIQGAGDDTENWALGLTAEIFWSHAVRLLSCPEADLPDLVASLVAERKHQQHAAGSGTPPKQVAPRILVTTLPLDEAAAAAGGTCSVALTQDVTQRETWVKSPTRMEVGLGKHKVASRNLRQALPDICAFVARFWEAHPEGEVVFACETGKDLSIGAALAAYCWCFDKEGKFRVATPSTFFNKDMIRVKLGTIMTACPEANASRATLQSVNSFLMDRR
ncbi:tRNA A64-2'-O-ribosylphosphate transferase [Colletotrichum spinosum]|uniref:tRNA A64-2'-O-ribosylphosphate transferase n=1 Tax=Colletotrichum spinosum TaxID=1347390 RepID=A0A4R8PQJ9_9PEZI|nr:tRNA A64-2'-O-ribosylphosphate transferase [Colletotrichum spinosum]